MATVPPGSIFEHFEQYGALHGATALTLGVAMGAACVLGRRFGLVGEARLRTWWAWGIVVFQLVAIAYWLHPSNFDPRESWPLHLCDVAAWVAALTLLTGNRYLRPVLYFWAIGLSTQAFFTPVLTEGLAHPKFWFFWIGHTQIVGSAIYDVVVGGFRPRWRDFLYGVAANAAYTAVVLPIDVVFGLNYGYIGPMTPERPTIIDKLGPWPGRVFLVALIVHGVMAVLWLAWPLGGWAARVVRRRGRVG